MLEVKDIYCGYGNVEVIKGVSFSVKEGDLVAIIGANGAGKTTTLKALSGLVPITRGTVSFEGTEISGLKANEIVKKGIIHIPEGRQVFPELSVLENLEMGGYTLKDPAEKAAHIEEMFRRFPRLKERSRQKANTLSGGEQQMLAVARALIANPRLLLLDEPSMGLSPKLVGEIYDLILELKSQGMTILLVEQNANMALANADYAYALQTGQIVLEGTGDDMLHNDDIRRAYLAI